MYPYTTIDPQAFANEQAMLQQRINQLEQENTIQALRDKLSDRDRDLQNAYNQISQVSQTRTIIDAVRPTPTPAYLTCSPYFAYNMTGYGGCCGNGGNVL